MIKNINLHVLLPFVLSDGWHDSTTGRKFRVRRVFESGARSQEDKLAFSLLAPDPNTRLINFRYTEQTMSTTTARIDGEVSRVEARDHWNAVIVSTVGWTLDSFDYFVVVMVLTEIATEFHRTNAEVALTLTVTLAFRPIGAFLFGLLADRYGRRIPLMIDVVAFSALSVASGLAPDFTTFLILRALFGIAMGGEWGAGASLVMEKVSPKWRGMLSGLLQQGYTTGYMFASIAYFLVVPYFGWRSVFFIGGVPALLALFIRSKVKESEVWEETRRRDWSQLWDAVKSDMPVYGVIGIIAAVAASTVQFAPATSPFGLISIFVAAAVISFVGDMTWKVAAGQRRLFFYLVLLLTFMGFSGHGTQDMYPTFLKTQHGFSGQGAALMTIIANLGALFGGVLIGLMSDRLGRRKSMVTALGLAILIVPLWAFSPTTAMLAAGAFLLQFTVHGAWGVVPAHVSELVPDQIRGFLPGFAYQCGILLAGSIAYLEAVFASHTSYSNAMALTAIVVFAGTAVVASLGPEKKGIRFGR
jgi:SHS family lactate transporter-like MFS transporter